MVMERAVPPLRWSDAQGAGRHFSLRELWSYRELVLAFVVRDLHVRYRQTVLGVAWVIVQPVAYTLVFSLFFELLGSQTDDGTVPSIVLRLSGAILWQVFAQSVQQSTLCLANNRQLITKTYFPRLLLPIAAVATPLIDFVIGWCLLLAVSLCFGVVPSFWFLLTPLLAIPLTCVSFTAGTWVSMLNALYRDVSSLVPFALQLGLIFTPVMVQTSTFIPERYRALAAVNPLVTIIDMFRAAWFGQPLPSVLMVLVSVVSTSIVMYTGLKYFAQTEDIVADRV
jgi:lipopolysaccharide transport system permease protein